MPTAAQSVAPPAAAISSGVNVCTLRRAFVGIRNRDALAADIVEVQMIFLLHALAQVLNRHIFLREFDVDGAALLLNLGQPAALFAQSFFALQNIRLLRLFLAEQLSRLQIHLLALVLQAIDLPARFLDFRFRLLLARDERRTFRAALLHHLRQLANALFQIIFLLPARNAKLFLGSERHFALRQLRVRRVPLMPQIFHVRRERSHAVLLLTLARFQSPRAIGQHIAFLHAFLLLRR